MLIAECAFKSGQFSDSWPHLNPEKAAELALNANAKRLALTHFDASLYPTIQQRMNAEFQAKKIFANTFIALDDMEIEL
jgi:ribonuclease BN (tRNA processing enzyme)